MANNVPSDWVKRGRISAVQVKQLFDFSRDDETLSQCLHMILSHTTKGGFIICDSYGNIPLFFMDDNTNEYLTQLFNNMLNWLLVVGFVPIAIESDVTKWASDNRLIERMQNMAARVITAEEEEKARLVGKNKKQKQNGGKEKKVEAEQQAQEKSSRSWSTRQNHSYSNPPSKDKVLPISIPEYGTGDFDIYLDGEGQVQMTFIPDKGMPDKFVNKRFIVFLRGDMKCPSLDGIIRTGVPKLFDDYIIKEAVRALDVRSLSSLSRDLLVGAPEPSELKPTEMSVASMFNATRVVVPTSGGNTLVELPGGRLAPAQTSSLIQLAKNLSGNTREETAGAFGVDKPGGFYDPDQGNRTIDMQKIGNAITFGLNQPDDANSRLSQAFFIPPPSTTVHSVHRAQLSNRSETFEETYQKNVCARMGVPYHLIFTEKGKYKPLEEQNSIFESTLEETRTMIKNFFVHVYSEAFHKVGNVAVELIRRLNKLSNGALDKIKFLQLSKVFGEEKVKMVLSGNAASADAEMKQSASGIQEGTLTIETAMEDVDKPSGKKRKREDEQDSELNLSQTIEQRLLEFDDEALMLMKYTKTIMKMVALVQYSINPNLKPRVEFKLQILPSLAKIKQASEVAGEDEEMKREVKNQFFSYMGSTTDSKRY